MPFPEWARRVVGKLGSVSNRLIQQATIGLGVIAVATGQTTAEPRIPVNPTPELPPDIETKKLGGKYVLQRTQTGPRVVFASHASHSSHASHASHASHSSSSHYSGSHYSSSSTTPAPQPTYVAPTPTPPPAPARTSTINVLHETFEGEGLTPGRWRRGLLIHPLAEYDHAVDVAQRGGVLRITPRRHVSGKHFYGAVSLQTFDLTSSTVSADVFQVPSGGASAIMALGTDATHYIAFRATGSHLIFEHRSGAERSTTQVAYAAAKHRFWRFRALGGGVIAWETSPDRKTWHVQHATEAAFPLEAVILEFGAGTDHAVSAPGSAVFDDVDVVTK